MVEVAGLRTPPSKLGIKPHQKRENETGSGGLKRSLSYQVRPIEKAGINPALPIGRSGGTRTRGLQFPNKYAIVFLTTFVDFLMLFSPKTMLSDALVRTVST